MDSLNKRLMGTALIIAPFVLGGIVGASATAWYVHQLPAKIEVIASPQNSAQLEVKAPDVQPEGNALFGYRLESLEGPLREYILDVIATSTDVVHRSVKASSATAELPKVLLDSADNLLYVTVGKPFTMSSGCSNRLTEVRYTIKNVSIDDYDRWSMTLTKQLIMTSRLDDGTGKAKEDRGPFPASERVLEESSFSELNSSSNDPVIYESNGVYEPIFVSPKEVLFHFTGTSC